MSETPKSRLTGLNDAAGILLFLIATVVAYIAANPRFPNENGPMPGGLPYVAFAFVLGLAVAAYRDRGWRRVARGFALGWLLTFALTRGGCTQVWTDMAVGLDPTRAMRARARVAARHEEDRQRDLPVRIAEQRSPQGRAYMARTLGEAAGCAFAYRNAMPGDGFPRTLAELGMAGDMCRRFADPAYVPGLELQAPAVGQPLPATRLALRLRAPAQLGIAYPVFEIDERGIVTVRDTSTDTPRIVASPVQSLLELRSCLLAAVPSRYRADSLTLLALTATDGPTCATMHAQTFRDGDTMELAVGLDSRVALDRQPAAARYVVRYVPLRSRPDEGFMLLAAAGTVPASTRHYLVTPDGEVHATSEPRDATAADPSPWPCERDPTVACR